MWHQMKWLVALAVTAVMAVTVSPVQAKVHRPNGRIVFGRFDRALGDLVLFTVNPDGSHERQLIPGPPTAGECSQWSPDGRLIATCGSPSGGATMLINPDTGSFRELPMPDPTLFTACWVWSPDGTRLACESFSEADPSRNGIYTIRSSDGSRITRITSNPGGDDIPFGYSPNGKHLVFDPNAPGSDAAIAEDRENE